MGCYLENLLWIFINYNKNFRNEWKIMANWKARTYKIAHFFSADSFRVAQLVSYKNYYLAFDSIPSLEA